MTSTTTSKKSSKDLSEEKYDKKHAKYDKKHPKDHHLKKDNAFIRFFKHLYKKDKTDDQYRQDMERKRAFNMARKYDKKEDKGLKKQRNQAAKKKKKNARTTKKKSTPEKDEIEGKQQQPTKVKKTPVVVDEEEPEVDRSIEEEDKDMKTPVDVSATPSTGSTVEKPAHRKRAAKPKKERVEKAGIEIEGTPDKISKKDTTKNKKQRIRERTKERMDGDLESKSSEESAPGEMAGPTSEENPQKLIKKAERRKRKRHPVEEEEAEEEREENAQKPEIVRRSEEMYAAEHPNEMEREDEEAEENAQKPEIVRRSEEAYAAEHEENAQKPGIVRRSEEAYAANLHSPRPVAEIAEPDVVEVDEPAKRELSDKERSSDEKERSDERSSYSSSISEERGTGTPLEQDEGKLAEKTEVTKADLHPDDDEEDPIIRPVSDENPIVLQEQERRKKAILGVDKAIPYKSDKAPVRGASGTNVPHE